MSIFQLAFKDLKSYNLKYNKIKNGYLDSIIGPSIFNMSICILSDLIISAYSCEEAVYILVSSSLSS